MMVVLGSRDPRLALTSPMASMQPQGCAPRGVEAPWEGETLMGGTSCSFVPFCSLRAMFSWASVGVWRPYPRETAWVTSTALFTLCCNAGQQPCSPPGALAGSRCAEPHCPSSSQGVLGIWGCPIQPGQPYG